MELVGPARTQRRTEFARGARHAATLALQVAVLIALALLFFIRVPEVTGRSMEPQLAGGDHVLINTLAYELNVGPWHVLKLRSIRRGEVVAFAHEDGADDYIYLKRVIALPGDSVGLRDGVVVLNGQRLREPYASADPTATLAPRVLAPGELFVLGDNRAESDDSRTFGPIPAASVIGRAAFICWPPGRVKRIR